MQYHFSCLPKVFSAIESTLSPAFDHATADYQRMMTDRYACLQSSPGFVASGSSAAVAPNGSIYNNCMAMKGYTRNDPGGRLRVPDSLKVGMY